MGLINDLPVWLQEIRDRADKATEGPWRKCSDWMAIDPDIAWHYVESAATGEVITGNYAYKDGGVRSKPEDAEFIIGARMDVPRLIGLVGEMGEAIRDAAEVLQEHVEGESVLIERLWRLWKKYRWEAEP